MQVVQAVCGTFHHFDLGRELEASGHLKRIYSTFPWLRLKREGVPRDRVRTFPWIHAPLMAASRRIPLPRQVVRQIYTANTTLFDRWVAAQIEPCDVFIGISGSGLHAGRVVQGRGGRYICDRGSAHIRVQSELLREEHARWGFPGGEVLPRVIAREEAEYAQADAITIPSGFSRKSFLQMGVDAAKLHVISYGVSLDRFRKTADPNPDSFEVLYAGAVSLQKGIPYLLEAFAGLHHPAKKLRLAGAVPREMRSLLARFPLEHVEFLGPLPQPKLAHWMSRSHVLVLPSIQDGFGMVMAQAMACGAPVIASEHTGGPDLFTEGVEGFVVPIRSPQAICERLTQLAADPDLRQRMSEAALARVRDLGGWHDYGQSYIAFLKNLTGQS